ncbi:MAG: hypothetical protein HYW95_00610 [Candidatus Wildermuthbacteria bacterium]|nr:hypothetical protein [Candidatus Wildermuthbacteria bacterium]
MEEQIKSLLEYAVRAPSVHNTQPWLFRVEKNSCKIYLNPKLKLSQADPMGRDSYISIGCCAENLILAAKCFGIFDRIIYHGENNLAAEVLFRPNGNKNEEYNRILETILQRVNSRGVFEKKPVEDSLVQRMSSIAQEYLDNVLEIHFIAEKEKIEALAALTAKGMRMAHRNPAFRKEMSRWINPNFSKKADGMPGYSLRMPMIISILTPFLMKFMDLGKFLAKLNYRSVSSAPLICIVTAKENSPTVWMKTGRLVERLMIELQNSGLQTSIFIAAIEIGDLHKNVQQLLGANLLPQFLFCAGSMAAKQPLTPKHPVEDKLLR